MTSVVIEDDGGGGDDGDLKRSGGRSSLQLPGAGVASAADDSSMNMNSFLYAASPSSPKAADVLAALRAADAAEEARQFPAAPRSSVAAAVPTGVGEGEGEARAETALTPPLMQQQHHQQQYQQQQHQAHGSPMPADDATHDDMWPDDASPNVPAGSTLAPPTELLPTPAHSSVGVPVKRQLLLGDSAPANGLPPQPHTRSTSALPTWTGGLAAATSRQFPYSGWHRRSLAGSASTGALPPAATTSGGSLQPSPAAGTWQLQVQQQGQHQQAQQELRDRKAGEQAALEEAASLRHRLHAHRRSSTLAATKLETRLADAEAKQEASMLRIREVRSWLPGCQQCAR